MGPILQPSPHPIGVVELPASPSAPQPFQAQARSPGEGGRGSYPRGSCFWQLLRLLSTWSRRDLGCASTKQVCCSLFSKASRLVSAVPRRLHLATPRAAPTHLSISPPARPTLGLRTLAQAPPGTLVLCRFCKWPRAVTGHISGSAPKDRATVQHPARCFHPLPASFQTRPPPGGSTLHAAAVALGNAEVTRDARTTSKITKTLLKGVTTAMQPFYLTVADAGAVPR